MRTSYAAGMLGLLLVVSIVLTIAVIPGVGLETRSGTDFPAWENSVFMIGGPILLVLTVVALLALARWPRGAAALAILVAVLTLGISAVGLGGFGASPVPRGVYLADLLHVVDALATLLVGAALLRPATPARP